jgi:MFS family permease
MISAPISETLGRKPVYTILFPISLLFSLGAALTNSFAGLAICRFLAGLIGSGSLAVGAGTNSDLFAPKNRAIASSFFLLAPFLGPSLGPVIGGFVSQTKGWRWTQYVILMVGCFSWLFALPQHETYKKAILVARAKRLGLPPPKANLPPGFARIKVLLMITVFRPATMLATESIVSYLSIYTAFNFSVLFAFFAAFPLVFQSPYPEIQVYHFTRGESGLVFIGIGLGCGLATALFILIDRLTYQRKHALRQAANDNNPLPPEERLQSAKVGAFLLPVGLFWFAWSARSSVHWISPVLATVAFGMGNLLVFCSVVLYLIDTYGSLSGASAAAANGILRYVAGAVFPLFTIQMYRGMGVSLIHATSCVAYMLTDSQVAWATSLLGFVTILLCPLPFVFDRFGPKIRARSKYAP